MAKKTKKKIKGIEKQELAQWFMLTLIYLFFTMIIGGILAVNLEDIYFIGSIPLDVQEAFWVLAAMVWGMVTVMLGFKFKAD